MWRPDDLGRARELQQRPGGRKRSQKRKHVQIHQLQQQVQNMQGLLQAPDRPAGFLEGPGRAAKRPCHPDELSLAVSGALEARESPQSSDLEEPLESDLGDEPSRTSESVPLDPSVRAIVARAQSVRAYSPLPCHRLTLSLTEIRGVVGVVRGCRCFQTSCLSCCLLRGALAGLDSQAPTWPTWREPRPTGSLQLLGWGRPSLC